MELTPDLEESFVQKLIEATNSGKLRWKSTENMYRFTCQYKGLAIEFEFLGHVELAINGEKISLSAKQIDNIHDAIKYQVDPPQELVSHLKSFHQPSTEDLIREFTEEPI